MRSSSDGDYAVTFRAETTAAGASELLATGMSPVYPCHVPPSEMRQHPIGTGPFKFVEFKRNEYMKFARNPDYWKPGRPYLDGVEWTDRAEPRDPEPRLYRRTSST